MNRKFTNIIRGFLDNFIPPIIRDSRIFNYPLFLLLYGRKGASAALDQKKNIFLRLEKSTEVYEETLNMIKKNRPSDLTDRSINHIQTLISSDANSLIDVGCGIGYFLDKMAKKNIRLTGFDMNPPSSTNSITFVKGDILQLPFEDNSFDVVTCFHTLEHIPNLSGAIAELKRIAKKQLIVVVPKQREFYHTFDSHVHFFPFKEKLIYYMGLENYTCEKYEGDWIYTATF